MFREECCHFTRNAIYQVYCADETEKNETWQLFELYNIDIRGNVIRYNVWGAAETQPPQGRISSKAISTCLRHSHNSNGLCITVRSLQKEVWKVSLAELKNKCYLTFPILPLWEFSTLQTKHNPKQVNKTYSVVWQLFSTTQHYVKIQIWNHTFISLNFAFGNEHFKHLDNTQVYRNPCSLFVQQE